MPKRYVLSVAWSGDGWTLASGSDDRTVKLWGAATGRELRTLRGHSSAVWSVAWSPDGRHLASGSDDLTVVLRTAATKEEVMANTPEYLLPKRRPVSSPRAAR